MTDTAIAVESDKTQLETWENLLPGRVSMLVTDPATGRQRTMSIKGKGQRIRVTAWDRKLAEEQIRLTENNPFRNGMLRRVDSGAESREDAPSENELSDRELVSMLEAPVDVLTETLEALSEVNVRRLKSMAKDAGASALAIEAIDDVIAQRWPVGGDTPTYREIQTEDEHAIRR